jgi:hypothetical protein
MVTSAYPGALALFLDGLEARLAAITAPRTDR